MINFISFHFLLLFNFCQNFYFYYFHTLQIAILERFGFIPYLTESSVAIQNQYVHVTGNMFVMTDTPGLEGLPFQTRSSSSKDYFTKSAFSSSTETEVRLELLIIILFIEI